MHGTSDTDGNMEAEGDIPGCKRTARNTGGVCRKRRLLPWGNCDSMVGNGDGIDETVGVAVGINDWVGTQGPLWWEGDVRGFRWVLRWVATTLCAKPLPHVATGKDRVIVLDVNGETEAIACHASHLNGICNQRYEHTFVGVVVAMRAVGDGLGKGDNIRLGSSVVGSELGAGVGNGLVVGDCEGRSSMRTLSW